MSDIPEWKVENDYSHYRPFDLARKEIRLVTIRPGAFEDPLHCTLTLHPLPCPGVDFDALSYCWGDLGDTLPITLCHDYYTTKSEQQSFNVTRSLDLALRHLRSETGPRQKIWIDALCINQGSIRERNHAIAFMVDVYRQAREVVIFLGDEESHRNEHFRGMWDLLAMLQDALARAGAPPLAQHADLDALLREVRIVPRKQQQQQEEEKEEEEEKGKGDDDASRKKQRMKDVVGKAEEEEEEDGDREREKRNKDGEAEEEEEKEENGEKDKGGEDEDKGGDESLFRLHMSLIFEAFFKYPWFRRVWVVQEALSARRAVVRCGARSASWPDVLAMLCWATQSSRSYAGAWAASLDLRDRLPPFLWIRLRQAAAAAHSPEPARLPLLDLIAKGRAFRATDPRDKVFALLSFGAETSGGGEAGDGDLGGLPPRLRPDYAKSPAAVWRDLTRQWIVDHGGSLEILSVQREAVDKNNQVAGRGVIFVQAQKDPPLPEAQPGHPIEMPPAELPSWALWHAEHPEAVQVALWRKVNSMSACSLPPDLELLDRPTDETVLRVPGLVLDRIQSVQWPFKRWTYTDDDIRLFNYHRTPPASIKSGVAVAWGTLVGLIQSLDEGDNTMGQVTFRPRQEFQITPYPSGKSLLQAFLETLVCRRLSRVYFGTAHPMSLDEDDDEDDDESPLSSEGNGSSSTTTRRQPLSDEARDDLQTIAHFAAHWAAGEVDPDFGWMPHEWAACLRPLVKHGSARAFTELCEPAEGRGFARAERAGIGLVPRGARAGDYVVSLAGGKVPFVLRRHDDDDKDDDDHHHDGKDGEGGEGKGSSGSNGKKPPRWTLIGEGYLHDLDIARITQEMVNRGREPAIIDIV